MNFEQEKADALKALEEARKMVENSEGLFSLFVVAANEKGGVSGLCGDAALNMYSLYKAGKQNEAIQNLTQALNKEEIIDLLKLADKDEQAKNKEQ